MAEPAMIKSGQYFGERPSATIIATRSTPKTTRSAHLCLIFVRTEAPQ